MVVALCLLYLLWGYSYGQQYHTGGRSGCVHPSGTAFGAPPRMLPKHVVVYPGTGFDGQFTFYIGLDPTLRREAQRYLDQPAYRYQRILPPDWLGPCSVR